MSETNQAHPACDLRGIREAVCVDTSKITDSCLAKDCIEDLRVYLTVDSQCALDHAVSAKARFVELLHVGIHVEAVPYNTGYYTLDATFYYRVIADAAVTAGRPAPITGLAVFSKRLVLFGGDSGARIFSSKDAFACCPSKESIEAGSAPHGVVEVVDPMILASGVSEPCGCCMDAPEIPQAILDCFDGELVLNGECKRLCVTIGQFSITRLERETQFLVPIFDYCVPTKECPTNGSSTSAENPCELFSQIDFPMDAFFPSKPDACIPPAESCTNCRKTEK